MQKGSMQNMKIYKNPKLGKMKTPEMEVGPTLSTIHLSKHILFRSVFYRS